MTLRGASYFLATAVTASAVLSLANLVWFGVTEPASMRGATYMLAGFGIFWAISLPFVLVGGLAVGLPVHLFLRKAGRCNCHEYLFVGLIAGMITAVVLGSLFLMTTLAAVPLAIYGGVAGASAALIWWRLAISGTRGEARAPWH